MKKEQLKDIAAQILRLLQEDTLALAPIIQQRTHMDNWRNTETQKKWENMVANVTLDQEFPSVLGIERKKNFSFPANPRHVGASFFLFFFFCW